MAVHASICCQIDCEQAPVVNVTTHYPPDALKPEGKESKTAFCLDHVAERLGAMFLAGNARAIYAERVS